MKLPASVLPWCWPPRRAPPCRPNWPPSCAPCGPRSISSSPRPPPLEAAPASRKLAAHAQAIYAEIGRKLTVDDQPEGGGTDAAFAALRSRAPVIERFGLPGFGAHPADSEWVDIAAIEPRLYLAARVVMDVARGKGL